MPQPGRRLSLYACLCLIFAACGFAQNNSQVQHSAADESQRVVLRGTVHPKARAENDRGAVAADFSASRMVVILRRPADREQALQTFLREAHSANSSAYHKWVTPEEFGAAFGAQQADIDKVSGWLQAHGFAIARVSKSRGYLEFSGTAAQVKEALHTEIHSYDLAGAKYFSVATDVSIPQEINAIIKGFAPLNTFPLDSYVHESGKGKLRRGGKGVQADFTTTDSTGGTFYALSPADFATQYNVNPVYQAGTDGTGKTIGIIGTANLDLSLVDAYRKMYGLAGNNTQVVIDGEAPDVALTPNVEGFLDVELSGAVAPRATINYYAAGGSHFQNSLMLAAMRAVEDNQADILSVSFGNCEQFLGPAGNQFWASLWEQAAAQGQTVLVASGDQGPATCGSAIQVSGGVQTEIGLSVNGIASTPWNIAVGGTDFYYSDYATGGASAATLWNATNDANSGSLKAPLPEQPWSNALGLNVVPQFAVPLIVPSVAGGGGASVCSQFFSTQGAPIVCAGGYGKPAWQDAPGVPADGARDLPDVSLFAASGKNLSAFAICAEPGECEAASSGELSFLLVGGTSASTPAMAGVMALIDQKYGRQGQANYTLYALAKQQPAVFHDVTVGTNDILCIARFPDCTAPVNLGVSINTNGGELNSYGLYAASAGYDMATGLGSVDVSALLGAWNKITFAASNTTLQISPVTITHGSPVNVTVGVAAASGTAVPTGDVAINTTSPQPLFGINSPGLLTLTNGAGSAAFNGFRGGTYQVTARYAGDGTFASSTSAPTTLTVTPEPSATSIGLQYAYFSLPPSTIETVSSLAVGGQAPFSSIWTFTATPQGQVGSTVNDATGSVTFVDGTTTVTVPLNAAGVANWSPQVLAVGAHSVTASYSGDASYGASSTTGFNFTVTKGIPRILPTLEIAASSFTNTGIVYPAGATVVAHVLVSALNSFVPPSGNVTVTLGTMTQTAPLSEIAFSNQGLAAMNFTFANVPVGTYTLSASYGGDANWNAASYTNPQTYDFENGTASPTTTSLSVSPGSVDSSGVVTFTVTVTATQEGASAPTGIANLSANGSFFGGVAIIAPAGAGTVSSTGTAKFPASELPGGVLQVTAVYTGFPGTAGGYQPSSSAAVPLTVTFTDFTVSPGAASAVMKSGASGSVALALVGPNSGTANVTLGCVPSAATFGCSITPAMQALHGSSSAMLTINAFVPGTAAKNFGGARRIGELGFALAFGVVLLWPKRRRGWKDFAVLCVLAGCGLAAGCGGGTTQIVKPPPMNLNAPPGIYSVVVTASSGTTTHNAKVTVVIQ